jgi:hypothetical protein
LARPLGGSCGAREGLQRPEVGCVRVRSRVAVCAMRVYYRPRSARPVRVAWLLEEIGAPYEPISVSTEETREPEHLARHPLGHVPVLETEG